MLQACQRHFCLLLLLLASSSIYIQAQTAVSSSSKVESPAPWVTASAAAEQVRFTSSSEVWQIRLEVFGATGERVFDSDFKFGNLLDWPVRDQHGQLLPDGAYRCVISLSGMSERLGQREGTLLLQAGQPQLQTEATAQASRLIDANGANSFTIVGEGSSVPLTALAHDGISGRIASGTGGLSFRLGDFFRGKDQEQMRLTADGKLALGVADPQAKLDVGGLIRTSEGIVFPDGSVQTTAYVASGRSLSEQARLQRDAQGRTVAETDESGSLMKTLTPQTPNAITATVNSLAKFTSVGGAQGDSNVFEVGGKVGIGTINPQGQLHIFGSATTDVFAGLGPDLMTGPAFNFGYAGSSFGRGAGFFNVRPDASAVAPNPSLRFLTANQQRMIITNTGNIGIGTTSPIAKLVVSGSGVYSAAGAARIDIFNSVAGKGFLQHVLDDGRWQLATTAAETRLLIDSEGKVGIGTTTPATQLHVSGRITTGVDWATPGAITFRPPDGFAYFHIDNGPGGGRPTGRLRFSHGGNPGDTELMSITQEGNVGIGTTAPSAKLDVAGLAKVQVLQITGGADLSEQFEVNEAPEADSNVAPHSAQPGQVVVIDPRSPGKLMVSSQAYDRRVAGIISGAGGVKPGMVMSQTGSVADGEHPVALTGRVYCWADASHGSINPGDLLTTADLPGHAMKVSNHARAQGAIIGKAMTSLKEGKGLVLVLVTLQ